MLLLSAEICFDTLETNPNALSHDPIAEHGCKLIPAINFGDFLFSGEITNGSLEIVFYRGNWYDVIIVMWTIDDESYKMIKNFVFEGSKFKIQTGARVIGKGVVKDYVYE